MARPALVFDVLDVFGSGLAASQGRVRHAFAEDYGFQAFCSL
jgi:hypothetical protein